MEKPLIESLKFNVDGSSKGKPGLAGIGGVLRDYSGKVKAIFSKAIGLTDSNVAELLAVSKALRIFLSSKCISSHKLIIENDSLLNGFLYTLSIEKDYVPDCSL